MAHLLHPYTFECYFRRKYLFNCALPGGEREWAYARVVALRSAPGFALCAEVALDEGAIFGPVPLSALAWKEGAAELSLNPMEHLRLLQPWDCFGADFTALRLPGMPPRALCHIGKAWAKGAYRFTVDWHSNPWSDNPQQGKRGHVWALEDGNFALLPNNRVRVSDASLTDVAMKEPPGYLAQVHAWTAEG